ncbi:AAA-ATPase At3g50940-like [Durio zibethinus]|uniref:AAA-ATPase At3g50940-like n=1 Tax=Durio zibethinus TaxID=66656 RepID=A0A6P6ADB9_DURZI|nr:AAA-ATPase At3g50940-like [Durio zibethinus]
MPSYEALLSAVASLAASAILLRTIANEFIPDSMKDQFFLRLQKISLCLSSQLTVVIEESDGLTANQIFQAANVYLGEKLSSSTRRVKVNKHEKEKRLQVITDKNQELVDVFRGVKLKWVLLSSSRNRKFVSNKKNNTNGMLREEIWYFELSFHKKSREMVLSSYLPYILQKAKEIKEEKKTLKLHTVDYNGTDYWGSINLDHPASFDTMAMDPKMKMALIEDLDRFTRRKEFYRRVGKAWKRGYLLYGPPGSGKSSLVATMANYLKFDVYDLDLKEVQCDSDLRRLLIGTGNRSIIVIEDIDNSLNSAEDDKVTFSGLLNFIDGLWSSCGDERIIVLTTNHKDHLDPVLLRPGRMDMHLHMSYCTFSGFRTLACNYLQIQDHPLFEEIKGLLEKVQATPAEVAGELMKSEDPDVALRGLIKCLHNRANAEMQQES